MISAKHALVAAGLVLAGGAVLAQGPGESMSQFLSEWDMNADGRVTADDVATRRTDLFDMFDLNGDGSIDAEEQANMAQTIAMQEENNHGGQGQGQGHGQGQGRGQGMGQGQGHGQGMGQGMGQGHGQGMGRGPGSGGAQAPGQRIHGAMTLAYNDADGNGLISAAEWAAASPRLFAELDGNGDGVVDAQDFGRNG
ncbi:MAG: hypothetical protein KDK12_07290 [Rhodobacteraceae bacterium]|nr:hypothetical protein [Paracoccaceae bacterium]